MTRAVIEPGICGLTAHVTVEAQEDMQHVKLTVDTQCAKIRGLADSLGDTLDSWAICFQPNGKGPLFEGPAAGALHAGCPVASGIIKCIGAECGLELKKDFSLHFEE